MALSVLIIALFTYCLGLPDVCALVSRYVLHDDIRQYGASDYPHILRHFHWRGVGYALFADVLRALVVVFIGGRLMKGAGFPSVGKLIAMLFALFAQCVPPFFNRDSRQDMVFPALLLLFTDWRLFLVCVVLAILAVAFTGSKGLMALVPAVAMPLFSIIFGNPFAKVVLALGCGAVFAHAYIDDIVDFFEQHRKPRREQEDEAEEPVRRDR